jgi:ABC-type polysaccharide/polyol phosphate export permease
MLELVQVLFAAWFFFTPVIYPISFIETRMPPVLLTLYQLNPMVGCVRLLHHVFVGMPAPAGELALSIPATVLLFVAGVWLFQKVSPRLSNASL